MVEENTHVCQNDTVPLEHPREMPGKRQRMRFVALTLVVVCTIGYLIFSGMRDTMGYYLTVSELLERDSQAAQTNVRFSGNVAEGSVKWASDGSSVTFDVVDEQQTSIPVTFEGVVPDTFQPGQKVILEGTYADGTFTATQMMTTCASKYE